MAIDNYSDLQTFLTEHHELSTAEVTQLPTLIGMAEDRLDRIITDDAKETTATLILTAAEQEMGLPADFEALQQVRLSGDGTTGYPLALVSIDQVEDFDGAGKPVMFAIHGGSLQLAPVPDAAYTLVMRYRAKLTRLSDTNTSNWLLAANSDAYVYMASAVICTHVGDRDNAAMYLGMADGVVDEINKRAARHKFGGSMAPRMVAVP